MSHEPRESYEPRNVGGGSVIDCEKLGIQYEACWGVVTMTPCGYRCRGHHSPSVYIVEPTPLSTEEVKRRIEEHQKETAARKAVEKAEWEARRWFRAIENNLPETIEPFWAKLSNPMLCALFSMVGEGLMIGWGTDGAVRILWQLGPQVAAEVKRRGLDWPPGYYSIQLAPEWKEPGIYIGVPSPSPSPFPYHTPFTDEELALDLALLSDAHLHALYGCASQVVDYSSLERGARQVCMDVYTRTRKALDSRGINPEFLMDWEP